MLATEHRPAPLPQRAAAVPAQAATAGVGGRRQPLPGTAGWSRTWLDQAGLPQKSDHEVPIDANDRRTEHVRYTCPDKRLIEVTTKAKSGEPATVTQETCRQEQWALGGEPARFCTDHGCQLTAGTEPVKALLPWPAIRKAVEPAARPLWLLAAELAAGIGVHAADVPVWAMLPAGPVLAGVGYTAVRAYLTRRAVKREQIGWREWRSAQGRRMAMLRRRARGGGYTGAAAGAWLATAAATDPASVPGLVAWGSLPLWWAVSAAPWWLRLEAQRNRPVPPEPLKPTVHAPGADEIDAADAARVWAEEVACPGTKLDPATWKPIKGGWQAVIVATKRGALNGLGGDAMAATVKKVAGGFDVTKAAIGWIDEYEGSPNRALLLVQPDSPLKDNIPFDPPGVLPIDNALLHVGMRIDGSPLRTRLWTPGWGAPSRWIAGTKGSGKTEFLRLLMLGMLEAQVMGPTGPRRLVAPFLHDPKRGKDYGAFRRQLCGFSTTQDVLHMIVEALTREMDRRYDALGSDVWFDEHDRPREGETAFDPTIHGPILSLVIDELHDPARDPTMAPKLDPFGRKMRAAGIEVVGASHMSTISDTLSQVFRDMMAGGESWLFRTTSGLNAALATGGQLVGDPRGLPREPGSVLVASGDEDTMQARTAFVPSEALYNRLYDERNRSRIMPVEWPPETLEAFGRDFVRWMRECQARQPGEPAPATPKPVVVAGGTGASVGADDASAIDGLRRILFEAGRPLARKQIAGHPSWRWSVTGTLTNALNAGASADPPWLLKSGAGPSTMIDLTPAVREQMQAIRNEERDQAA